MVLPKMTQVRAAERAAKAPALPPVAFGVLLGHLSTSLLAIVGKSAYNDISPSSHPTPSSTE